ncbi:XdhC family protein [Bordetella sp. 15P40C-2]|uniref:XdhC family protein n=1 Tax=Bordetella sp. 15P40C-2 TaxID=2572246 RepID=UPI0013257E36|nr:XdhC family protein [Bordetella sp. 15P40C-2]MVW72293.1 XdhC family protein [Bordetella sp. 15P40C-2]
MDNIDVMVLRTARDWLRAGDRVLLATVIRTWGSSPRPVGAMMALNEDGRAVGSVSGGCIEDDLIQTYTTAFGGSGLPDEATRRVTYGVTADEAHRFGLPCGGTLELLLECRLSLESLDAVVTRLHAGELLRRTVSLADGRVKLESADTAHELMITDEIMQNTLGPGYRMLLIGAGSLTEYVATIATFNGFAITVCDPRREYMATWCGPQVHMTSEMPDDAVNAFRPDARSCIIALTHDPKLDDLALLEALRSPAFYIGAIGSRRNNAARRQRMIEHFGETEATLARLRGPIGVYIGSKTPAEIAVSLMAEIIAVKNGVQLPKETAVAVAKEMQGLL